MFPGVLATSMFFLKEKCFKKMSLKNLQSEKNVKKNLQPQIPELQFLKKLSFARAP